MDDHPNLIIRVSIAAFVVVVVMVGFIARGVSSDRVMELPVPYVPQVLDGNWVAPWDEACEEASLTMIDAYYTKRLLVPEQDARKKMEEMFAWERTAFHKIEDTNAEQTAELISAKTNFSGTIQRSPSIEDIAHELENRRPVIALVNMYDLYQERNLGDSYHVLVIIGYDVAKKEFIVNDPARKNQTRYSAATLLSALHDFDEKTREASGIPTVIFTKPQTPSMESGWRALVQWVASLF